VYVFHGSARRRSHRPGLVVDVEWARVGANRSSLSDPWGVETVVTPTSPMIPFGGPSNMGHQRCGCTVQRDDEPAALSPSRTLDPVRSTRRSAVPLDSCSHSWDNGERRTEERRCVDSIGPCGDRGGTSS
jgi:hypothetical protein